MKTLRILTGLHAGIQVRLDAGTHRIGRGDDADVCINDWSENDVLVDIDADGIVRISQAGADSHDFGRVSNEKGEPVFDNSAILLQDFVPFPFAHIVLCFGTSDIQWPPDIELLAGVYLGKPADVATSTSNSIDAHAALDLRPDSQRQRRILQAVAGMLAVGGIALGTSAIFGRASADTNEPRPLAPGQIAAQINAALHTAHLPTLRAEAHDSVIEVDGVVSNPAEDAAARKVLLKFHDAQIARHYDVAENTISSVEDALGDNGVRVEWHAPGLLSITGDVASLANFRQALDRVEADLDPNVQRIEVDVGETNNAPLTSFVESMTVGDTQYVQTPDGVKHVFDYSDSDEVTPQRLQETIVPAHVPPSASDTPALPQ